MSDITKESLTVLRKKGLSFSEIGRAYNRSRERIRQLSNLWEISAYCAKCHEKMDSARRKYCPDCRKKLTENAAKVPAKRRIKTFTDRPVVQTCYNWLTDMGLDVVLNAEAGKGDPEIFVGNQRIKCIAGVPLSLGHQVRIDPMALLEHHIQFLFVSDGDKHFFIPKTEITKPQTYIGIGSPLQMFATEDWHEKIVRQLI
jgi:hypothetical protein